MQVNTIILYIFSLLLKIGKFLWNTGILGNDF
jgi:hypothetical protein